MTLEDLKSLIVSTPWFSRLGQPDYEGEPGFVHLPDLSEWKKITEILPNEPVPRLIEDGMEKLPTGRDEDDPIHGRSLEEAADAMGEKEKLSKQGLEIYKAALVSLRKFQGHPLLKVGPHDFTESARGAALYAARRAAFEILLAKPDFWCRMLNVFHDGHWPFGIMPDGRVVVL